MNIDAEKVNIDDVFTEKTDSQYLITIHYNKEDGTEIVLRILSFGPMIKVTAAAEKRVYFLSPLTLLSFYSILY